MTGSHSSMSSNRGSNRRARWLVGIAVITGVILNSHRITELTVALANLMRIVAGAALAGQGQRQSSADAEFFCQRPTMGDRRRYKLRLPSLQLL